MQKTNVKNQLKELTDELRSLVEKLQSGEHFTSDECKKYLDLSGEMHRLFAVYQFLVGNREISADLDVHLKIMEAVEKKEMTETIVANKEPEEMKAVEVAEEKKPEEKAEEKTEKQDQVTAPSNMGVSKRIEMGINDKYRILNELFSQNQTEFNTVMNELNSVETYEQAETYLNTLAGLYSWKRESPLVKTFYAIVKKRFA